MNYIKHYTHIIIGLIILISVSLISCNPNFDPTLGTYTISFEIMEYGTAEVDKSQVGYNGEVTLTATPQDGYRFVNWTVEGKEVSKENPYTALIIRNTQFRANFEKDIYTIRVTAGEGGTAKASKTEVGYNGEVTLTATPQEGCRFVNWTVEGKEVSKENPYRAIVKTSTQFRANFEKSTPTDPISSLSYDELVYVEGGTFTMGATSEQGSDYYSDERPTHSVTLSSYYIGKYEVTQQLWEYVMSYSGKAADGSNMSAYASDVWLGTGPSSSRGEGSYYPAYYVSWNDIVNIFLPRLNKITGGNYRLPTEAEWEYAARGGKKSKGYKYSGSNNIEDVAWYPSNSGSKTHPVGQKQPNELGIYDMSGNVYEWCYDWYSSSYYSSSPQTNPTGAASGSSRVFRGGGWNNYAYVCRVSYRSGSYPDFRYNDLGFRLASSIKP